MDCKSGYKSNNYNQIMSNSNNPYPDLSTQPLLTQAPPPPPRTNNYQPPNNVPAYNPQGYSAQNQVFHQPYLPPNQAYPQPNQGFQPNQANQAFAHQQPGFQPNNQGFQPNNQGYSPNGPNGQLHCPFCGRWTDTFPKKVAGGVTYIWCFALFLLTGIFCCIPFCVDGCQDTNMVCVVCQGVKARIEANCC